MGLGRQSILAALLAAASPAAAMAEAPADTAAIPKIMQSCDAHKFETVVVAAGDDGQRHQSKVKLCGNEGQTDAEWIHTLEDAIAKLNANTEVAPAVRDQIVTAIKHEITRLKSPNLLPAAGGDLIKKDSLSAAVGPPLSQDYSPLPPLPSSPPPPPKVLLGSSVAPISGTAASVSMLPSIATPKLSYACYAPGDIAGDAPCTEFMRDTLLTIRAEQDVPAGIALRFVRNGSDHGEIALAQLRRGKSMRIALPASVCSGFTNGRLDLQIVHEVGGASEELSSDGPYSLRC